ncbi:MAG: hypothetical protein KA391_00570 [Luteimonas sp.]|nr:hypothetical protein [Luteimonas sp.]
MTRSRSTDDLSPALRLQLRGLRQDALPQRDLWPDIAPRLSLQAREAPASEAPPRRRVLPALAAAAVLVLAAGVGWLQRPGADATSASAPAGNAVAHAAPLVVEADAMTREYQGALREVAAMLPDAGEHATLSQLDASADLVRDALAQDPDARFLLQRLQRIYAQRLSLTQRLARA